jgi:hypothetical protein
MNQIERLNTFSEDLQSELNRRSRSTDLVKTRSPFLRFTTGANMSQLQERFGERFRSDFSEYSGYKFFSIGLHGWDNKSYKESDLYGQRSRNGLMVGITYKNNEKKVVYTKSPDTNRNYPPPGILNAKVERLRNGNVLKFTIDCVCYTQQQLDILDIAAFSPGMTCILEWGSVESTQTNSSGFSKMLDFTKTLEITDTIKKVKEQSRSSFIEEWCKPNNYNYDFVIANIANVSTVLENNAYIVTVTAYGVADNIMYISAYATSNPQTRSSGITNVSGEILSSAREYFKVNGRFTRLLEKNADREEIIKFSDPMNSRQDGNLVKSTTGLSEESIGLEDVYFIKLDYFINYFLNNQSDGVISLINPSLKDGDKLRNIIYHPPSISENASARPFFSNTSPTTTATAGSGPYAGTDPFSFSPGTQRPTTPPAGRGPYPGRDPFTFSPESTRTPTIIFDDGQAYLPLGIVGVSANQLFEEQYVGYNEYLRSSDPDVMILYNPEAIRLDENNLTIMETLRSNFANIDSSGDIGTIERSVLDKLSKAAMINYQYPAISGYTSMADGIWINSRAIQASFLGARTIYEGIESLLLKMNSATENYWDLKLHYDDDLQSFRIIDDNLRIPPSTEQNIYVFNKKATNVGGGVMGSDILDISIQTDYPRMMFSQLAIAAINNLPSLPESANSGLLQNKNLEDLFSPAGIQSIESQILRDGVEIEDVDSLTDFILGRLGTNSPRSVFGNTRASVDQLLSVLQSSEDFEDGLRSLIIEIYQKNYLISKQEAIYYADRIGKLNLTRSQLAALSEIITLRTKSLITKLKRDEADFYRTYILGRVLETTPTIDAPTERAMKSTIAIITDSINRSANSFKNLINRYVTPFPAGERPSVQSEDGELFERFVNIPGVGG